MILYLDVEPPAYTSPSLKWCWAVSIKLSSQKEVDQNGEKRLLKGRHPRKTVRSRVQALGCRGDVEGSG